MKHINSIIRNEMKILSRTYEIQENKKKELTFNIQEMKALLERAEKDLAQVTTECAYSKGKLDQLTYDLEVGEKSEFLNAFLTASYFTPRGKNDEYSQYIQIKEDKLMAVDGNKGIIVKCSDVPEELRNKFIKWDVREKFEENAIEKDVDFEDVFDIDYTDFRFKNSEEYSFHEAYFRDTKEISLSNRQIDVFKNKANTFNKGFERDSVNLSLSVFEGGAFDYLFSEGDPIIFKNKQTTVVLLEVDIV